MTTIPPYEPQGPSEASVVSAARANQELKDRLEELNAATVSSAPKIDPDRDLGDENDAIRRIPTDKGIITTDAPPPVGDATRRLADEGRGIRGRGILGC